MTSSSASNEVAESFFNHNAENDSNFQLKTLFKFVHPKSLTICSDVSWISPFSNERELIILGTGLLAILEPSNLDLTKLLQLNKDYFVKTVIIAGLDEMNKNSEYLINKISNYFSILKQNMTKLSNFDEKILGKDGLLF